MTKAQPMTWVILAGGQARRMNHNDKGLLLFKGKALIEHQLDTLTQLTDLNHIFISANRHISRYEKKAQVLTDVIDGFIGPLAGILTGLRQANTDWVGFVPCDSPFVSIELLTKMTQAIAPNIQIICPYDKNGKAHPTIALIHRKVLPKLDAFLASDQRKVMAFYQSCALLQFDGSAYEKDFININTPEHLKQLSDQ